MGRGRAAVFTVTVPLTWQDDTVQVLLTLQFKQVLQKHLCRISVFLHIPYALSFTYLQLPQWTVSRWPSKQSELQTQLLSDFEKLHFLVVNWIRSVNRSSQVLM